MNFLKTYSFVVLVLIIATAQGMKKEFSIDDNYHQRRLELFEAIKKYDIKTCENLFKKYKDLPHTQCEIKHENGETHYFPLWYLLSLETKENQESNESKLELVNLILNNTTDIKWAYDSLCWSLETICGKKYPVTDFTVTALKKAIEHFVKQRCNTQNDELKKIASRFQFNLSMFALNFNPESKAEKSLSLMVKLMTKK